MSSSQISIWRYLVVAGDGENPASFILQQTANKIEALLLGIESAENQFYEDVADFECD